MAKLGGGRMPRVGSNEVDERGVRLIHDWIASLRLAETRREQLNQVEQLVYEKSGTAADRARAIEQLLQSTDSAMVLLHAMDDDQIAPPAREKRLARTTKHAQADVRELFERFVPLEHRVKRVGDSPDPAALLAIEGDAARGKQLFFEVSAVQCKSCHRIGAGAELVGPDLSQIGKKYDKRQLLESLLEPSKTIDPKYMAYVATTGEGRVYSGILLRRSDAEVVLRDAKNQEVRIAAKTWNRSCRKPNRSCPTRCCAT